MELRAWQARCLRHQMLHGNTDYLGKRKPFKTICIHAKGTYILYKGGEDSEKKFGACYGKGVK
jgi:hypothetical protein